jgi:hypothetical protein
LILGSKTAAFTLSDTSGATNYLGEITGYLANELVKILLPDDAEKAVATISKLSNNVAGQALLAVAGVDLVQYREAIIRGLNRGAEHAANLSVDVFATAITRMTFESAKEILFGEDSIGATNYLRTTTSDVLRSGFKPIIDNSFTSVKVSALGTEYTVKQVWTEFVSKYNSVAAEYQKLKSSASSNLLSSASLLALEQAGVTSVDPVSTDIVEFATGKALDGLFFMVGRQEVKIRKDPAAALSAARDFVTKKARDLIEKVFTSSE